MIRQEPIAQEPIEQEPIAGTNNVRARLRVIRGGRAAGAARPTLWSRFTAAWARVRAQTPLDRAMNHEIGRYFAGRPAERGDVAAAERLIRDLDRNYGR